MAGGVTERPRDDGLTAALPDDRAPALDGRTAAGPVGRSAAGLDRADRRRCWRVWREGIDGGSAAPAARSLGLPREAAKGPAMALASQAFYDHTRARPRMTPIYDTDL